MTVQKQYTDPSLEEMLTDMKTRGTKSLLMLMLDSGQAQACQVIEVSRTYLVYLNYFYPDSGRSSIYSSHYSLVIFLLQG